MKRSFALILVICLILCGCAGEQTTPTTSTTAPTTVPTQPTTQATDPTTAPTTEPTTAPTEPEPTEPPAPEHTDPLTGEAVSDTVTQRPFAVVLNNATQALPHWSVSQCQMLWELPHEYGTTRMVAMYSDVSDLGWLGSMRSARTHHISLAQSFNALFVHAGYSPYAKQALKDTGWETINGVEGKYGYKYFHRDQSRLDAGIALEHTMYTTGPEVIAYCKDMGYVIDSGSEIDYGYTFAPDGTPAEGADATSIDILFKNSGKKSRLTYDDTKGTYSFQQYGMTYIDGLNGEAVEFENVLILKTWVGLQPDSDYRLAVGMTGSGTGYYACGGKMVEILWSRSSDTAPFVYTLTDGTPLTMGIGTTYAAVIHNDGGKVTAS